MKQTINFTTFANTFQNSSRKDQFSYEALELIFDYIEQYESETGEEIEFDTIAICCEWSESTPENIVRDYKIEVEDITEDYTLTNFVIDYLNDETIVAGVTDSGSIVYVQF